ncbi:hypothetical protein VYU27_001283 [Nannochloropsis oceanica]
MRRRHVSNGNDQDDLDLSASVHAESLPTRKYSFDSNEPLLTLHQTLTPDGVSLTLKQYVPRVSSTTSTKTPLVPIILAHGLAGNSCPFDVTKTRSLAYSLCEAGYTVWLSNMRGSGTSDRPSKAWTLDDYIYQDVPTIVHFVRNAHGDIPQVHYLGHSLGGICILCALADVTPSLQPYIKSVITIASSLEYNQSVWRFLAPLVPLARMITSDKAISPEAATTFALSFLSLVPSVVSTAKKIDKDTLASYQKSLEPVSLPVIMQLGTSIEAGGLAISPRRMEEQKHQSEGVLMKNRLRPTHSRSSDDWFEEEKEEGEDEGRREVVGQREEEIKPKAAARFLDIMHKIQTPILAIAGNNDVQCGEEAVLRTLDAVGSARKRYVLVGGVQEEEGRTYGHLDLLLGERAKEDVFCHIVSWVQEADSGVWERRVKREKEEEGEEEEEEEVVEVDERRFSESCRSIGL